jgi:hypothetical protein
MAKAGQVRSDGVNLTDHVALAVLISAFPPSAVATAIEKGRCPRTADKGAHGPADGLLNAGMRVMAREIA